MEMADQSTFSNKNATFLRARDPSIVSYNHPQLNEVRMNLIAELESETQQIVETDQIKVYLRIKKTNEDFTNLYTIHDPVLSYKIPESSKLGRNIREGDSFQKSYHFSKIFSPNVSQTDIFNFVVKPKFLGFINGENSTLLTYGVSGSGKTFTLIGTDEEPGILPRSLEYLFRTLPNLAKYPPVKPLCNGDAIILSKTEQRNEKILSQTLLTGSNLDKSQHMKVYTAMQQRLSNEPVGLLLDQPTVAISVWVSFAEIYNEQIYDLLTPDPPRGKPRTRLRLGAANHITYIKNLTYINIHSGLEAFQILHYGLQSLKYASTNLNSHSSRSHSIFTIKLVQTCPNNDTIISNFNFCDLAGSERSKKTKNVGDRLKESNNINNSLSVLGRCISAVRNAQKSTNDYSKIAAPYRDSKLTQLFQRALAGEEDIGMIVTISPARDMFDETTHVLNFSAIASQITVDRRPKPMKRKKNRFSAILDKAQSNPNLCEDEDEVEILRDRLLDLESEYEAFKASSEESEGNIQQFLRDTYENVIKAIEEGHKERLKELEDSLTFKYEAKIKKLRQQHQEELRNRIIEIDSEDDEPETSSTLTIQIKELRLKLNDLEVVQMENETLNARVIDLEQTVDEGVQMYRDLERKYQQETSALKTRCVELECEKQYLEKEFLGCQMEFTEMCSDTDLSPENSDMGTFKANDINDKIIEAEKEEAE